MDKGPWRVMYDALDRAAGVRSDDFEHDVILKIDGDFAGRCATTGIRGVHQRQAQCSV
jgi:hypothetical protein